MGVHVDEVHTDVVPAVLPASQPQRDHASERIGAADDQWRELHHAVVMTTRRTLAEGFSD